MGKVPKRGGAGSGAPDSAKGARSTSEVQDLIARMTHAFRLGLETNLLDGTQPPEIESYPASVDWVPGLGSVPA